MPSSAITHVAAGLGIVFCPPCNSVPDERHAALWRRPREAAMRVKLCVRCPYTPRDLAHHYDPEAVLYACAKCDDQRDHCLTQWRRKCTTRISTGTVVQSAAPSARENSASSVIIARASRSAQRSVSINSGHDATATAGGCGDFAPPDGIGGSAGKRMSWHAPAIDSEPAC
jgi:hypothetical protein